MRSIFDMFTNKAQNLAEGYSRSGRQNPQPEEGVFLTKEMALRGIHCGRDLNCKVGEIAQGTSLAHPSQRSQERPTLISDDMRFVVLL
jgi:hypothetical protein